MKNKKTHPKITFITLTPLWTGDAWGENREIRPSSLMGSLRFWFYIYSKIFNIPTEQLNEKGIPLDNLEDYLKKYNKRNNLNHTFESLIKTESKKLKKNENINSALKKVLDKIGLPLISQIFGCTGWKSQINIKDYYSSENYILEKDEIDFSFLYNEINSRTTSSKFWLDKILFNEKNEIVLFNDVKISLKINSIYLDEFKKFLKFYNDKIILVGGKKSFGFGFCRINSNLDLNNINLPSNQNLHFKSEQISISNLPNNKKISGFNFKHYQRLKEEKRFREKNFGKQGETSKFFFSAYDLDNFSDVYIFGFKDELNEKLFDSLFRKYKNFEENKNE